MKEKKKMHADVTPHQCYHHSENGVSHRGHGITFQTGTYTGDSPPR